MPPLRSLLTLLLGLAAALPAIAQPIEMEVLYLTGDEPPGIPGGEFSAFSLGEPVTNAAGQVAFPARLEWNLGGVQPDTDMGVWGPRGAGPAELIVQAGDLTPGIPGDVFEDRAMRHVSLNDLGEVAFESHADVLSSSEDEGIWRWSETSDTLVLVALASTPIPGASGGELFDDRFAAFTFNDAGVFLCHANASGFTFLLGPSGDGVTLWLEGGDPVPAGSTGETLAGGCLNSSPPMASPDDEWAFRSITAGTFLTVALSVDATQSYELLAIEGAIPGDPVGFGTLDHPFVNASGAAGFVGVSPGFGIWGPAAGGGSVLRVSSGDSAPGTGGATFSAAPSPEPLLSNGGHVSFSAGIQGAGVTGATNSGAWRIDPDGNVELVAREGDATPGGGQALGPFFSAPVINALGDAVFVSDLDPDPLVFEEVLYHRPASGPLQRVLGPGDTLEVAPGDVRTVSSVALADAEEQRHGRRSLNDDGILAFRAAFDDGTGAILRADLHASVHVPAVQLGWALLALVGLVGIGRRALR